MTFPPPKTNSTADFSHMVACLLSGSQRAAVATIAMIGSEAQTAIQRYFTPNTPRPFKPNELRYGSWQSTSSHAESVVVVQIEDSDLPLSTHLGSRWEIHCHGGELAADRILNDLAKTQIRIVEQATFAELQQPKMLARETDDAIRHALTIRTARYALQQQRHGLSAFVSWAEQRLSENELEAIRAEATEIHRFASFGFHLTKPWRIVLAGLPNVGKSSLMNTLVGFQRSITYDLPGTTRDVVTCDGAIDGWPVTFSDTAGIRDQTSDGIEQQGVERAKAAIAQADLVVRVGDVTSLEERFPVPLPEHKNSIEVINKIDRLAADHCKIADHAILTSTVTGQGINQLIQAIAVALVPKVPSNQQAIPLSERQATLVQQLSVTKDKIQTKRLLIQLCGL